jgi:hypothetical protein
MEQVADIGDAGEVGLEGLAAALRACLQGRFFRVIVVKRDFGAFGGEAQRDIAADALGSAGDEGYLSGE